ncbi:MAG: hypothetical protein ABI968_14250 [Acidobacteriota bacterium]
MIQAKGVACVENRLRSKRFHFAVAGSLLFVLGLCTALAQTPTSTPTTTAAPTLTPILTLTATPNASASPTATPTRTKTPIAQKTKTPTTQTATPLPGSEVVAGYIPVAGSTAGNFGSFFRTSVQLLNPGGSSITGRLIFHPTGVSGQPSDPSQAFALAPGQIVSYPDFVAALGLSGLGSVDVTVGEGQTAPIVITRVFDDSDTAGTSGFTEPFVLASDVPSEGSGFLVGPSDVSRFRFNIGIRTLDGTVSLTATVRDSAGNILHSVNHTYDPNVFIQTSSTDFLGFTLGNDQSIEIAFTGGGLIAYGATIDNVSNDPSAQFLSFVPATPIAQQTEAPRRGSSTPMKLALLLAMLGAGGAAIVIAKR